MKKLVLLAGLLIAFANFNFAQTAPAKKDATKKETVAPTKKDGTPDKRYKENKASADTTKKRKKDGTPDMRYKDNKKKA